MIQKAKVNLIKQLLSELELLYIRHQYKKSNKPIKIKEH